MANLSRFCERHPGRPAIGVCVMTRRAICAECSTQYRGVNYSKEGLEQLLAQERGQEKKAGSGGVVAWACMLLLLPAAAYLMWLGFEQIGQLTVDLLQIGDAETGA
ncbi:MAG: hypothetical protein AAGG38_00715 [Planctomycetota bacterium]